MYNALRNYTCLCGLAALLLFAAVSCRKSQSAPVYPYLHFQIFPYDTTTADGIFMIEESYTLDSSILPVSGYASFFRLQGVPQWSYANAAITNSGWQTKNYANGFSFSRIISGVNYWNQPLTWLIRHNSTDSAYYTDSMAFPYFSCAIPDTVSKAGHLTLHIDSITNADSVLFKAGNFYSSPLLIKNYVGPATDSITLDFSSSDWVAGNEMYIGIVAFTHHYATINGKRYLFIRQREYAKTAWMK